MLSLEEAQSRAQDLVSAARKAGADAADAIYACNASTNISVRLGALEDIERSEGEEIGLRVFIGNRSASISASDRTPQRSARWSTGRWQWRARHPKILMRALPRRTG